MKIISNSPEETREVAKKFVEMLKSGEEATVIALIGDLGSGKTSFSQFVGEALGVHDPIQSPTFLIEKIYELKRVPWEHMIHIDAYRLESEQELLDLGWKDIVSRPGNIILVEWADKVMNILPPHAYHIVLTHVDETKREIEILAKE